MRHERSSGWRALGLCCFSLSLSCGGSGGYGDAPGSGLQVSIERRIGPPSPEILLLVVDDRADAADLVASVLSSLDRLTAREVESQKSCALVKDPAAHHPIDWSAVIVHPSAIGDAIYTSPADDPALRWSANQRTEASRTAFLRAVEIALAAVPSESGPFAALEAFQRSMSLVSGLRASEGSAETALLAGLPENGVVKVSLVLARDDESPEAPAHYAVSLGSRAALDSIVVPAAEPLANGAACRFARDGAAPRLSQWLEAEPANEWALWPCEELTLFSRLSDDTSCERQCVDFRPLEEDDGSAVCLVLVDSAVESCDENAGWLDPQGDDGVRAPVLTHTASGTVRTCEVRQLTGSALESCQRDLDCAGCEPGWCLTQVIDLLPACTKNRPLPLRFVGGSNVVANARATVICNAQR